MNGEAHDNREYIKRQHLRRSKSDPIRCRGARAADLRDEIGDFEDFG